MGAVLGLFFCPTNALGNTYRFALERAITVPGGSEYQQQKDKLGHGL
jgi:hypothetical protein